MKKKTLAVIAAFVMTAAAMTACGDNDSSSSKTASDISASSAAESKAEESKAEESKAEESKADESKAEESKPEESKAEESKPEESKADESKPEGGDTGDSTGWGPLAKAYTDKLASGVFSLDMNVKTSLTGSEMPMLFETDGKNIHIKMNALSVDVESYVVDGKTYSMVPSMNAYTVSDGNTADMSSLSTYGLNDGAVLTDSGEKDGMQFESYKVPVKQSGETTAENAAAVETDMTYYFDASGELKKIDIETPVIGKTEVTVNAVKFDGIKVELPDLSGLTKLEAGSGQTVDPKSAVKMSMSLLGITEDMVTAAGYTVDQLASMDTEEMAKILADIAVKSGVKL